MCPEHGVRRCSVPFLSYTRRHPGEQKKTPAPSAQATSDTLELDLVRCALVLNPGAAVVVQDLGTQSPT